MRQLRRPASQITPDYEDSGLFKSDLCVRQFDLVPIVRQTDRADVEVTSVTQDGQVVPVLFAGRRRSQAAQVIALLEQIRAHLASPNLAGSPGRLQRRPRPRIWSRIFRPTWWRWARTVRRR